MLVSNLLKLGSLFIQYAQRERALRFYAFTLLRFYALRAIGAFSSIGVYPRAKEPFSSIFVFIKPMEKHAFIYRGVYS